METIACHLDHIPDERLRDLSPEAFRGTCAAFKPKFSREPQGRFRDSLEAFSYAVEYTGRGTRSDFIENILLDRSRFGRKIRGSFFCLPLTGVREEISLF